MRSLNIIAGPQARAHLAREGLKPEDISVIPAAAGGPKGLILQGLDHHLFGDWLGPAQLSRRVEQGLPELQLIGASIGGWRMAAACASRPVEAFKRLADQYCEGQRYPKGVTRKQITEVCEAMVGELIAGFESDLCAPAGKQLLVWVNRGKNTLYAAKRGERHEPRKGGFASAVLSNAWNRNALARYFERWVFHSGPQAPDWLQKPHDGIPFHFAQLGTPNLQHALLASGSIPFVLDAVPHIHHHSGSELLEGPFWDGGLTDYHLALPYHRTPGLVLYPHFSDTVTPGWLDKFLKLRKARPDWMSNVILISPSREFVASLPAKKIPDRSDFKRYGLDHDLRIRHWRQAIAESHRLAEEFAEFVRKPDGTIAGFE